LLKKITDHCLVPKHEIVPKEKVSEVLEKFGADIEQLPRLLKNDPAVEAIKAERGDLIKITRDSPTAGKTVYFRVVI
jgi:DNA-directed RNA polymerase subunit H